MVMLWAAGIAGLHGGHRASRFQHVQQRPQHQHQQERVPVQHRIEINCWSLPELQRSRDFDILVVGMELWKYDYQVFEELNRLLGIRSSAAHPGMLTPSAL